jgi:hypothetical protein
LRKRNSSDRRAAREGFLEELYLNGNLIVTLKLLADVLYLLAVEEFNPVSLLRRAVRLHGPFWVAFQPENQA